MIYKYCAEMHLVDNSIPGTLPTARTLRVARDVRKRVNISSSALVVGNVRGVI